MEALGVLASAALGLSAASGKKTPAKRRRADDPEVRTASSMVPDNEQEVLPSTPMRVSAKRMRGAKVQKKKKGKARDEELEEQRSPRTPSHVKAKRARGHKSRKRKACEDDLEEIQVDDEDLVTPLPRDADAEPRSRGSRGDREKRARVGDAMLEGMTAEQRNTVVLAIYHSAQQKLRASGRERFSTEQVAMLLDQIRGATGEPDLTWHAIQLRVGRMLDKGSYKRAPGSGRKTTMTPLVEEAAKEVSRLHRGDISGNEMYHQVKAKVGSPAMCGKSTFYRMVRGPKFKRRRVRYRPKLTDQHKKNRVAFATEMLRAHPDLERRIIFVDEKRFEVVTGGTLLLPAEDDTPQRAIQSRTNPLFVMVLVGVMKPRDRINGVVGRHAFVDDTFAAKNSKRREKGTLELKAVNVSGPTYVAAWRTLFTELKKQIDSGLLEAPTAQKPLFFQDDNAKPHRAKIDGRLVSEIICEMGLKEFGIHIQPLEPRQPAQSPDTNPLDTFVFRKMAVVYRRVRAESLVKYLMEGPRRRADADGAEAEELLVVGESEGPEDDPDEFDDADPENEFLVQQVPLRCGSSRFKRDGSDAPAKCPGCQKIVRDSDAAATQCDMRDSWWHADCAKKLVGKRGHERATDPTTVEEDENWVCPQCAYHLCRSDSRKRELCLKCGKPSARSGNAGHDMVMCDGKYCGLFHRNCVDYDEEAEQEEDHDKWYCLACSLLTDDEADDDIEGGDDEGEEVPTIEEHWCHENSVQGVLAAIDKALSRMSREAFERGFESRRVFFEKIIAAEGGNNYDMHYRGERKRKAKEATKEAAQAAQAANVNN